VFHSFGNGRNKVADCASFVVRSCQDVPLLLLTCWHLSGGTCTGEGQGITGML
jgi:hypothetical protein